MIEMVLEEFLQELHTEEFGKSPVWLYETSSTIARAQKWLREGGPHGAVVIAARQTKGQGRQGRDWISPEGGLWMSILTRPVSLSKNTSMLGLGLAVAAAQALEEVARCEIGLKWPNDLVIKDRKLGGILVTGSPAWETAVLSVGLNVNMPLTALPKELQATATTLLEETGREVSLGGLAAKLLAKLEALWPVIITGGDEIAVEWRKRDALLGQEVLIELAGKVWRGLSKGVDKSGQLLLEEAGIERAVATGEVVLVRKVEG